MNKKILLKLAINPGGFNSTDTDGEVRSTDLPVATIVPPTVKKVKDQLDLYPKPPAVVAMDADKAENNDQSIDSGSVGMTSAGTDPCHQP